MYEDKVVDGVDIITKRVSVGGSAGNNIEFIAFLCRKKVVEVAKTLLKLGK